MAEEVSVLRLYVLRGMYPLNGVLVGSGVGVTFIHLEKPWDPMLGVAFSFWAALFYKTFWLIAVYVPLRAIGSSTDLTQGFLIGIVLDLIVIPWPYVFAHYIKKPGDRWR